ncbi:MAG: molybdate ABC transporter substrate-binding protein [Pseudomonadota bacterium]
MIWRGLLILTLLLWGPTAAAGQQQVTIFAAASTQPALSKLAERFEQGEDEEIGLRLVFAATSTLAKQIAAGAPADLFLAASEDWMDYLARRDLLAPGSRRNLLGNRLALIAPANGAAAPPFDWSRPQSLLALGRLALGDPDHVPAGIYAKAALETLGVWPDLAPSSARTANVRAALALVERKEVGAAIVYRSDAQGRGDVVTLGLVPSQLHPPIRYPLAIVAGRDSAAVRRAYDFLSGPKARAVFAEAGFQPLANGG